MGFSYLHNPEKYFEDIRNVGTDYILPFLAPHLPTSTPRVLDVGCGSGGMLNAFAAQGGTGVGLELLPRLVELAHRFNEKEIATGNLEFRTQSVFDYHPDELFDLVLFKDSIEHVDGQDRIIKECVRFLKPGGVICFVFPPWYAPFGGHQQILPNKFFARAPWYHLLPMPLYRWLIQRGGATPAQVDELVEIKELGISTARFQKYVKRAGLRILARRFYVVRPGYKYRFGWKPRVQPSFLGHIPYLRDFLSTAVYYVVAPKLQVDSSRN